MTVKSSRIDCVLLKKIEAKKLFQEFSNRISLSFNRAQTNKSHRNWEGSKQRNERKNNFSDQGVELKTKLHSRHASWMVIMDAFDAAWINENLIEYSGPVESWECSAHSNSHTAAHSNTPLCRARSWNVMIFHENFLAFCKQWNSLWFIVSFTLSPVTANVQVAVP